MEEVMALRDSRQAAISKHPLFEWLHSDRVAIEDRLKFAPMGAFFMMQFRDMNRWVLQLSSGAGRIRMGHQPRHPGG